jgi:protein-tyrosine phosphatase
VSPFIVLFVCIGNICRSPMAERLLVHAVREHAGDEAAALIVSESVGTGSWHVGEPMNPPAAAELRRRGVSAEGFRARRLAAHHIDTADLILVATSEQLEFVEGLRPDAMSRSFVLGEFARLIAHVDADGLPPAKLTPEAVHARGIALVAAVDAERDGAGPLPSDDLDDPWGRGDKVFRGTADQIASWQEPLVNLLFSS